MEYVKCGLHTFNIYNSDTLGITDRKYKDTVIDLDYFYVLILFWSLYEKATDILDIIVNSKVDHILAAEDAQVNECFLKFSIHFSKV
jgi:hypothetical protein